MMGDVREAINEGRYQKLRLADLVTDIRFNRPVRAPHVNKIVSAFVPGAFRTIDVWQREDGGLVILDGQHRCKALETLGVPTTAKCVPALVHNHLTLDQAAWLFVVLNANKLVSAADVYKALLTAGETETVAIDQIVRSFGLRVATNGGSREGAISAVTALREVYRLGEPYGTTLGRTLASLFRAWAEAREAYGSQLIKGVGLFLEEHREVEPDVLADALARRPGAPINLLSWARIEAGPQRMAMAQAIALVIEKRVLKPSKGRPKSA